MQWLLRVLRGFLLAVLFILCAFLFYILVIMGDTGDHDTPAAMATATPAALARMPQSTLYFEGDALYQAETYFNAPIMKLSGYGGWKLRGVTVTESTPEGAGVTVREIRLHYENQQTGYQVNVSSITPSKYLRTLPGRGLITSTDQNWMLAGMNAVLMSGASTLHLHAQNGEVIYQIEGDVDADTLREAAGRAEM